MRCLILITLLALGHSAFAKSVSSPRAFEDIIINTLECVRGEMLVGWPDFGIPHLNPLRIEDHTFNFADFGLDGVTGELTVTDLVFSGLIDFTYDGLSGTIGLIPPSYTVKITLRFANPILSTNYVNVLNSDTINTWGTGTLDFSARNFRAAVDLKATILGGIKLEYFHIIVGMDPLESFVITGVRDDEAYSTEVSADILANGATIIDENAGRIDEVASEVVLGLINEGDGGEEDGFIGGIIDRCLGGR
nr:uncharacterized protein LOC111414458 [Onthophagus taurus]